MQDIINNITSSALFGVTLSIFAYVFGVMANKKLKTPIANPVLIADIIIVTILLALNIPYENYAVGGSFIELFLAPVTAALAVKIHAQIKELKANTIPSVLDDVTAAIVNGNYALDFGLKTEEAIYKDSVLDEEAYWNLIAARTADLQDQAKLDAYRKVVKAFQSEATEKVFNETFGGYFIKVGWDQDLLADK